MQLTQQSDESIIYILKQIDIQQNDLQIGAYKCKHQLQEPYNKVLQYKMFSSIHQSISEACWYCHQIHTCDQPCVQLCLYCQSIHKKKDLVQGMCPKMAVFARKLQEKERTQCKHCQVRPEQDLFYSLLRNRNITVISETDCVQCKGKKYLPRLLPCCPEGCNKCGFTKFIINPSVKFEHMSAKTCEDSFQCSICLQTVEKGQSIFIMQCNHRFHYRCLREWLLGDNKKCPICRQEDMLLQNAQNGGGMAKVLRVHLNESGQFQMVDDENSFSSDDDDLFL